jgi:hypothetical protein
VAVAGWQWQWLGGIVVAVAQWRRDWYYNFIIATCQENRTTASYFVDPSAEPFSTKHKQTHQKKSTQKQL